MFEKINRFLQEVRQEMAKVSWPSRDELKGTTIIVIVLTIVLSVFIWLTDKVLEGLLKIIY
ncbi:MAG: preprotein translocase subunit SecE [candidate division KSB1 bacterium]|nr:preprotein translocase subunit SecE [candidate division KSB1 bacterium]MDZ7334682.1 preprotein translocase subunit SecE [candidate division KSB1 bacterium]MDZ7358503.1 preprotein translocase subunit SecE [candidate division KSB1 bacterium]MDZ7402423.1 preprotein translocase subunit SecE [candidate division KSB1 bacterium]